jgi:hypothetical protein
MQCDYALKKVVVYHQASRRGAYMQNPEVTVCQLSARAGMIMENTSSHGIAISGRNATERPGVREG